jgi:hypothetical protein
MLHGETAKLLKNDGSIVTEIVRNTAPQPEFGGK